MYAHGGPPPNPRSRARPEAAALRLTRLFGRGRELAELEARLGEVQLVTLLGPPGCGKTRLATEIGARVGSSYREGCCVVELAPLDDPGLVADAVGTALGIPEQPGRSREEVLEETLAGHELLLILDNCEHLVEGCASLLARLLPSAPGVRVLATGRVGLNVPGEQSWRVPPLDLANAVALLEDRCRLAAPRMELGGASRPLLEEICQRLDALPLALELAAARARILSLREILDRLDDTLSLLGGVRVGAGRHQRTLQAALDWSYRLLDPSQAAVFERLGVFVGSFDLAAAQAVAGGAVAGSTAVLEPLADLVDHSLVLVEPDPAGATRYRMLETIRHYALDRLQARGALQPARLAHAVHYLGRAAAADAHLGGPERSRHLRLLEAEHDNLRAAIRWAGSQPGDLGLQLGTTVSRYWALRGAVNEGRGLMDQLLAAESSNRELRASALLRAARLAWLQRDYAHAWAQLEESLAIKRELGDVVGVVRRLSTMATVAMARGELDEAERLSEESLALLRERPDQGAIGWAHAFLGWTLYLRGSEHHDRSRACFEQALAICEPVGNLAGVVYALGGLASVDIAAGDLEAARKRVEGALAAVRRLGGMAEDQGWLWGGIDLAVAEGRHRSALRLAGAIDAIEQGEGVYFNRALSEHWQAALDRSRQRIGEDDARRLMAEGGRMDLDQLIAEVLSRPARSRREQHPAGLSEREVQVLALVAAGRTNREIAAMLSLSPKTIDNHLTTILNKTGTENRAAAAAFAIRHGLA